MPGTSLDQLPSTVMSTTLDAIDQALSRMTSAGEIRRITRGLYDLPRPNSLTGKPTNPDPRRVIDALVRRDQARMLVDGLTAANDLGLTDAVPAKISVHTDARLRPIKLGAQTITFKPTAPSRLHWAGRPAMRVVLIEEGEPTGPFGAKAVGEIATIPVAAAVVNAVNHALGAELTDLPLSPERILAFVG